MAVGVAKLDGKNTLIISLYLDIKFTATPDFFLNALKYAQHRGYSVLIGCDTNSHSTLWGKETNKRGEDLEDIITEFGLDIHNRGLTPTYECQLGSSIIDVTLSMNLKLTIDNWKVDKTYNNSDHHSITYTLKTELIELQPFRPYNKANWDILSHELDLSLIHI